MASANTASPPVKKNLLKNFVQDTIIIFGGGFPDKKPILGYVWRGRVFVINSDMPECSIFSHFLTWLVHGRFVNV